MNINKDRLQMYVSLMKITIVLCWLSLFSFWAIKLFGGNWFSIIVKNENFLRFSNALQNTWLKYVASFITISLSTYLALGAIAQRIYFKGLQLLSVIFAIISSWVVANFVNINFLKMWYGYIIMLIFAIVFLKRWKKLLGFVPFISETLFAFISMTIRNIEIEVTSNYLIALILIIDMYIMSILYYLYSNLIRIKKEI